MTNGVPAGIAIRALIGQAPRPAATSAINDPGTFELTLNAHAQGVAVVRRLPTLWPLALKPIFKLDKSLLPLTEGVPK